MLDRPTCSPAPLRPSQIGATASGIETEGVNPTSDWNPQTAYGLSYYTIAPQAMLTGTAKLSDGKLRKVKGAAWIEHREYCRPTRPGRGYIPC